MAVTAHEVLGYCPVCKGPVRDGDSRFQHPTPDPLVFLHNDCWLLIGPLGAWPELARWRTAN